MQTFCKIEDTVMLMLVNVHYVHFHQASNILRGEGDGKRTKTNRERRQGMNVIRSWGE